LVSLIDPPALFLFPALFAVMLFQPKNPQAGAISLLGIGEAFDNGCPSLGLSIEVNSQGAVAMNLSYRGRSGFSFPERFESTRSLSVLGNSIHDAFLLS